MLTERKEKRSVQITVMQKILRATSRLFALETEQPMSNGGAHHGFPIEEKQIVFYFILPKKVYLTVGEAFNFNSRRVPKTRKATAVNRERDAAKTPSIG